MASKQILVVEDDEQIQYLLTELLKHFGFRVITAADVPTALNELREKAPDLVILDMVMKGMDGTDFLTNAEKYLPENISEPPIIVLSVVRDQELVNFALQHGAKAYLTKPFNPSELVDEVKKHLH